MLLPKIIKFKIGDEDYTLRIESIWFYKNKILPRYKPEYYLQDSKGKEFKLEVKNDADYKELLAFIVTNLRKNLISNIINLFTKLNPLRS